MKTTLKNPETKPAKAADPIPRMRELLTKIPTAKEEAKVLDCKASKIEHFIRSTVFNALDRGVNYSIPLEKVVNLHKSSGGADGVDSEVRELKELTKKASALYDGIESDETELDDLVRKFGSKRDQELLQLHGVIVAQIEKAVRPFVANDKEANAEARGFNLPTFVHTRIGGWTRYSEILVKARTLIAELELPLPEVTSNK
jgi:hypothetical protein